MSNVQYVAADFERSICNCGVIIEKRGEMWLHLGRYNKYCHAVGSEVATPTTYANESGIFQNPQKEKEAVVSNRAKSFPSDPKERKTYPVASGVMDYFPDALVEVAHVSYVGNEQHNAGEPLHWAREKSTDEADALIRHFLQRGSRDSDGIRHSAKMVWRALALLQKELEVEDDQKTTNITNSIPYSTTVINTASPYALAAIHKNH